MNNIGVASTQAINQFAGQSTPIDFCMVTLSTIAYAVWSSQLGGTSIPQASALYVRSVLTALASRLSPPYVRKQSDVHAVWAKPAPENSPIVT